MYLQIVSGMFFDSQCITRYRESCGREIMNATLEQIGIF